MKYYLCALLLCGAFFSYSQEVELPEYHCPDGGTLQDYGGEMVCSVPAPVYQPFRCHGSAYDQPTVSAPDIASATAKCEPLVIEAQTQGLSSATLNCSISVWIDGTNLKYSYGRRQYVGGDCLSVNTHSSPFYAAYNGSPTYSCPPDESPDFASMGGTAPDVFCWKSAETLPTDEDPPPQCDDVVGNCEPDPQCVQGGGGMMVCKDNPDDKCWVDEYGHDQCQEGCGFVNDAFFCATEPTDNPDFAKCKFTFNGYACPSEPEDDITEPQKPSDQMTKQDFKQTNVGVESRLNLTNDLLETQLAADERNAGEITGAINNMNQNLGGKLNTINGTLGGIGEGIEAINNSLNPEETREIGEPESWYTPVYEDGISGVWDSHRAALDQTPLFTFLDQFSFAPSGTQPDWNMCFNLGALGNYGCERLEVPAFIWNFIRIVMLLGAAFTARRLVFGG